MKLRVAPDVYDGIYERALREGRSMNQIAEKALASAVKRWNAASSKEKSK
jgi:predicted HicB family RNase H-like nuclease